MAENPTPEEVRASIVPKSDQLNADDLLTGPITATITKVRRGDKEQPIIVELEGHRPYKPCKTMRRVLIGTFGDDPKNWVGQQLTLYCDPEVLWAGVKVGGIRISHLTGLENPRTFMLTTTRGKKSEVTVRPIAHVPALSPEEQQFIKMSKLDMAATESVKELEQLGKGMEKQSEAVKSALRPVYKARLEALK